MVGALIGVDACRPWFRAVPLLPELAAASDPLQLLNRHAAVRAIRTGGRRPLQFVDADDAPTGIAYEAHIFATGRVPTRCNRHDLFNALVWLMFPLTKARLNELQAAAIARDGVRSRGTLRDAATLFDENGAVLVARDQALPALLRAHRWREAFVDRRCDWERAFVVCFGHALMDKLAQPFKGITAHTLVIIAGDETIDVLDQKLSEVIDVQFGASLLTPLPVLGVPGWWPANAAATFYDDAAVFRHVRARGGDHNDCLPQGQSCAYSGVET